MKPRMSDDLFAKLFAEVEGESTTTPQPAPQEKERLFPEKETITLMTANFFDNASIEKEMWTTARHALNMQVFDLTEPFTPDEKSAAFFGTVQLHSPEYFARYLEAYRGRHKDALSEAEWAWYRALVHDTLDLKTPPGVTPPKLGQLYSKSSGTHYVWNHVVRVQWTEFGTIFAELFCGDSDPLVIDLDQTVEKGKDTSPVARGRYDPHTLWRRKERKKKSKTP